MNNLVLFLNSFLSYLLCFVVIIILAVVAVVIGVKMRKNKDAKLAAQEMDQKEEINS